MRLMTSISRFMLALLGVVGRVGTSIVARAGAGTRCKVTGGAHACYPTTMRCSLRRALTSSGEALPVTCMRVAKPMAAIVALGVALIGAWNAAKGIYPK